jgi:kynurenine formamidase
MRFNDLSATIGPSDPGAKPYEEVEIRYAGHTEGTAQIQAVLGVPPDLLRDGEGWAIEELTLGTHSITHVDAPWHYNSHIQGQRSATVDELLLNWFFADGIVLELTRKTDTENIEPRDLATGLAEIGYVEKPLDIVLLRTARDRFYGQPDYSSYGCAVTAAAILWLYERGVRVMGIDAWGWDGPLDKRRPH